jgi:hypothetical protein
MQLNLPITKPEGTEFFFIAGRFHLIRVLEVWILRIPPHMWDCIKVLHETQISVMPRFCIAVVSPYLNNI